MKQILFATTNKGKLHQFQYVAKIYNFPVHIVSAYDIFAIAPYSEAYPTSEVIVEKGSSEIFQQIHTPVIVEDTIFTVDALDGRPGLEAAAYLKQHGRKGILQEMQQVRDRRAKIVSCLGYRTALGCKVFKHIVQGKVALAEAFTLGMPDWVGPTDHPSGGGYNAIFIPDRPGQKTMAELTPKEGLSYGYRERNFREVLQYIFAYHHHAA